MPHQKHILRRCAPYGPRITKEILDRQRMYLDPERKLIDQIADIDDYRIEGATRRRAAIILVVLHRVIPRSPRIQYRIGDNDIITLVGARGIVRKILDRKAAYRLDRR